MTIIQAIETNGARETARKLLNRHIYGIIGLRLDDLPDTSELCEIVDTLEDILTEAHENSPEALTIGQEYKDEIREVLEEIDIDTLQNYI